MELRKFSGGAKFTPWEQFPDLPKAFDDTVRRFVEDERGIEVAKGLENLGALGALWGQEAAEKELAPAEAAAGERDEEGGGAGNHFDGQAGFEDGAQDAIAGIGEERRTGIADQGHTVTTPDRLDEFDGTSCLIVLVIADGAHGNAEVLQEFASVTGIFTGNHGGFAKNAEGAQRDVLKVADGRGNDAQYAGHGRFSSCNTESEFFLRQANSYRTKRDGRRRLFSRRERGEQR